MPFLAFFFGLGLLAHIFRSNPKESLFYINEGRHFDIDPELRAKIVRAGLKFYVIEGAWMTKDRKTLKVAYWNSRKYDASTYRYGSWEYIDFEYDKDIFILVKQGDLI